MLYYFPSGLTEDEWMERGKLEITRKRNLLEVLLLVMVRRGIGTPYDLDSRAGLPVGATSPALKRLEVEGLLTSEAGARRKLSYSITERGDQVLNESVKLLLKPSHARRQFSLFESAPRIVLIAWLYSNTAEAVEFVRRAVVELGVQSDRKQWEADDLFGSIGRLQQSLIPGVLPEDDGTFVSMVYRWMKAEMEARLLRSQAESISGFEGVISRLPEPPKGSSEVQPEAI
jgi:DNA-binding PadR family transcriptional regulator